jgi:peroxiredoxin
MRAAKPAPFRGLALLILLTWLARPHLVVAAAASPTSPQKRSLEGRVALAEAGAKALVGSTPLDWQVERWQNSPPLHLSDLRGKVVLVRWWTAGCPYCRNTAPALRAFSERFGSRGLTVVGIYHHKEDGPFLPSVYEDTAKEYRFAFPLAYDPDWRTFRSWMHDSQGEPVDTGWTSVTFLLDKKGVVRHVHPGGQYLEGDAAYKKLTSMIEQLLEEKP